MASRLRSKDAAALQRALESQRFAAQTAQERNKELQQALDNERSAAKALRRESAAHERSIREEEGKKYAILIDQLKNRLELAQSEALAAEKENTTRILTVQFQRELHAREEQWRRDAKKQLDSLQEQLKATQQRELEAATPQSQTDALVHSLHADFQRTLRQKQEEWRRENNLQVDSLTNQLRELQRALTDTMDKLTKTTNEAELVPKLRQEITILKLQNKELEEKLQVLAEADRRKVEEFRALHEDNSMRIAELQKSARKEAFQLLEEMKSKDRSLFQLQREYHNLANRLSPHSPGTSPRARSESSNRGGDPLRKCIRKPKSLSFTSDLNKRMRAQEGRKPPDPPEPEAVTTNPNGSVDDVTEETESSNLLNSKKESLSSLYSSEAVENWTKTVGIETLYHLLLEEHQSLQLTHHNTMTRLKEEERTRARLENQMKKLQRLPSEEDNVIKLALADQIQVLQERQAELEAEALELREQNDLLEFRILELDDGGCAHSCTSFHFKSPTSSRSPDTRDREIDDVSDSGVMSLPTSEDISEADFQDFKMEPNNRDVKSKLSQLCQSLENVSERISIQQGLALLRHYEARLENLEATLAAMCQEATQSRTYDLSHKTEHAKSPSRIIATVLPFTDPASNCNGDDSKDEMPLKRFLRDQDCMQESGIFEDAGCLLHSATQTDWTIDPPPGDLGAEIRKLTQIRERIEEKGGNKRLLKTEQEAEFLTKASLKELLFYRDRVQTLEDKVAIYESRGDVQSKLLTSRLEKEVLLAAQVKHLQNTVSNLKEENRNLEEEKCEYEEAENDTRLRCQKLEVKLSALGEKKSDLQVQMQQNARTLSNLRSTLSEEERKRNEARHYAAKLEGLVNKLEQQNFEMEEKEMELRYRLHTLENVIPAMVVYYMWRMVHCIRPLAEGSNNKCLPMQNTSSIVLRHPVNHLNETPKKSRSKHTCSIGHQELQLTHVNGVEQYIFKPKVSGEAQESPQQSIDSNFVIIEELSEKCHNLEETVKELQLKEKIYQETLQNGDDLFNKKEMEYKRQLKHLEDELMQKRLELNVAESKLRKYSSSLDQETQLQDRVHQLETHAISLNEMLVQKDRDRKVLESEKARLNSELEEALNNLEAFKKNIEKPLTNEVESLKLKVKELLSDLDKMEQDKHEEEEMHRQLVKELKKVNNLACRQLDEHEVTISELKEEVQTLEKEVGDLRGALRDERDHNERQLIQVGAELEAKDQQLRSLKGGYSSAESLHEELLQADLDSPVEVADIPVDHRSMLDISASDGIDVSTNHLTMGECQRAEQIVAEYDSKGEIQSVEELSSAYLHSKSCPHCKTSIAKSLRHILRSSLNVSPHSKMSQLNHLLLLR